MSNKLDEVEIAFKNTLLALREAGFENIIQSRFDVISGEIEGKQIFISKRVANSFAKRLNLDQTKIYEQIYQMNLIVGGSSVQFRRKMTDPQLPIAVVKKIKEILLRSRKSAHI